MTDAEVDAITYAQWGEMKGYPLAAHRAYARAIESAATAPLLERIADLEKLSVTNIMLSINPGWDGIGEEVYAKSVADVEAKLGDMGQELEEWQLGIKRHHAMEARIAELEAENTRLEGLVYSPGLWRCAKCKFTLVQRNLNAHSGTVTARDQPGDKCPNCDVNLWRVTERENALENYEAAESLQIRLNDLEAKLAQQAEAQEPVYQVKQSVGASIWADVSRAEFDAAACLLAQKRVLFTRPQPAQLQALSAAAGSSRNPDSSLRGFAGRSGTASRS